MKHAIWAALILGLAAPLRAEPDAVLPWGGAVPHGVAENRVVVQVFDAVNGRPVVGAVVRVYDEDSRVGFLGARILGRTVTDEFGLASVERNEDPHDAHWTFEAKGYAVHEEYGSFPPDRVWLLPGGEIRATLLDPFGRPAVGVEIELLLGCGHSPSVRIARTNAEGVFRMTGVQPGRGRLWCRMADTMAEYIDVPENGSSIALEPGRTITGVLVNAKGVPVEGAIVTSLQTNRGPATVSDDKGRFRLVGVGPDEDLWITHHSYQEGKRPFVYLGDEELPPLDGARPPLRLRVPPSDVDPDDYAEFLAPDRFAVPIRVVDQATGKEIPELPLNLVSERTGLGIAAEVEYDEEDEETGRRVVLVSPGGYRVSPAYAREDAEGYRVVSPDRVEIAAERTEPVVVRAAAMPVLNIEGITKGMGDFEFLLATPSDSEHLDPVDDDDPVHLPAGIRAVVRVRDRDRGVVRFFPVGPVKDGRRSVTVEWEFPADEPKEEDDAEPPTVGAIRLVNAAGQPVQSPSVRIERRNRASWGASDEEGWFGSRGQSGSFSGGGSISLPEYRSAPPFLLIVEGYVTKMITAGKSGDLTVRYAKGAIDLTVQAPDGSPLDFGICVDGMPGKGREGKLLLRGVEPGRRKILIGAAGFRPVLCRIDVPEDAPKPLRVTLGR